MKDLCLDVLDVDRRAAFWAHATGLRRAGEAQPVRLVGPSPDHTIWINPSTGRARWSRRAGRGRGEPARGGGHDRPGVVGDLIAVGANRLGDLPGWTALADPEGNAFCVLPPG